MRDNPSQNSDEPIDNSQSSGEGWEIGETHASSGIGLDYNPQEGPYYPHLSLQDIPATPQEARLAEFDSAFTSKWNVTHDLYMYGKAGLLKAFSSDPEAASKYLKQAKDFHNALPEVIASLPSSQKSWTNSWGPALLGGIADPATFGIGGVAEKGVALFAPRVMAAVAKVVPVVADTSLKGRVIQGAIHGALTGAAGGALSSVTAESLTEPLGYHTTYSEFMSNVLNWTGLGALGGGFGGGLLHYLSPKLKEKYDPDAKTPEQEAQSVASDGVTTPDTTTAANRMGTVQSDADKNIDASVVTEAGLNEARANYLQKTANWERGYAFAEDKEGYSASHPKPSEQYAQLADDFQTTIDELHERSDNIADEIINHPDYADDIKSIPLPSLMKGIDAIDQINDLAETPNPKLEKLSKVLKNNSYINGPAKTVKRVLQDHEGLVDNDDIKEFEKLYSPEHELEQLESIKKISSDKQGKIIKNRISALKKVISKEPDARRRKGNPIAFHLGTLDGLAHRIDGAKDAKEITENTFKIVSQPISQIESKGRQAMRNMSDPNHDWTNDNLQTKVAEDSKDNRPYQVDPTTNDQMDRKIDDLVKAGILTEDDLKPIRDVEEQEKLDAGDEDLNKAFATCIASNFEE